MTVNPTPSFWYDDRAVEVSVAEWAVDRGDLITAVEVVAFFEKPWYYDELHNEWKKAQAAL